jgi:membrane protein implicated in regulation of membrane protease activity
MARRLLAIVILLLVAIVAIRIVVGAVIGLVHAVLWIAILAALVVATIWAWRALSSARKPREVKKSGSREVQRGPAVDPIEVEMQKITEELRKQGRG